MTGKQAATTQVTEHQAAQEALAAARQRSVALRRVSERTTARRRTGQATGLVGLVGGATTAALTGAAVIAGPIGWVVAGVCGLAGVAGLWVANRARERETRAAALTRSFEISDAGKLLELDAVVARINHQRSTLATAYATHEATIVAETGHDGERKSTLLARLRTRQLTHVRQLDALRQQAVALQTRLAAQSRTAEPTDWLSDAAVLSTVDYDTELQRNAFRASDLRETVTTLSDEADALEELVGTYELA